MKIIHFLWGGYNENILTDNLIKLGNDITTCSLKCNHYTRDLEFASKLITIIHEEKADSVVSFNYFPIISLACNAAGIQYYAWVYDSPHLTLFAKTVNLECNHIGVFDKVLVDDLNRRGINTVFHLPLGGCIEAFSNAISSADTSNNNKYSADVSFVGQLYTGKKNHFEKIYDDSSPEYKAVGGQGFNYIDDVIAEKIIDGTIDFNKAYEKMAGLGLLLGDDFFAEPSDIIIPELFDKEVTAFERRTLVKLLSEKNIDFKFYTTSETDIKNYGPVDYMKQMPLVFRNSKININLTLRSIRSGIPLRALDILSCGGFLLSNYQSELAEFFREDVEIVLFRSLDECLEKIDYYLAHDEERRTIAANGFNAVRERMSDRKALSILLEN